MKAIKNSPNDPNIYLCDYRPMIISEEKMSTGLTNTVFTFWVRRRQEMIFQGEKACSRTITALWPYQSVEWFIAKCPQHIIHKEAITLMLDLSTAKLHRLNCLYSCEVKLGHWKQKDLC